jgi:hypothetical protein
MVVIEDRHPCAGLDRFEVSNFGAGPCRFAPLGSSIKILVDQRKEITVASYGTPTTEQDDEGPRPLLKYKSDGEARFNEIAATGRFVRLVSFDNNSVPYELQRANDRRGRPTTEAAAGRGRDLERRERLAERRQP